jgi:hypothetical protein
VNAKVLTISKVVIYSIMKMKQKGQVSSFVNCVLRLNSICLDPFNFLIAFRRKEKEKKMSSFLFCFFFLNYSLILTLLWPFFPCEEMQINALM